MNLLHTTLCLAACFLTTAICAQAKKPNIIYILTDDLGYVELLFNLEEDISESHDLYPECQRLCARAKNLTSSSSSPMISVTASWVATAAQSNCALYHLKDDLGEKNNLAETHPDQVESLTNLLDQWEIETAKTALPFPEPK